MPLRLALMLLSAALVVAACDPGSTTTEEDGIEVVATTSILGELVEKVVGKGGSVTVLMGPGVDPHEFQLAPEQAARLRSADLVVINGLGLEESITPLIESASTDGANVVALAPRLDPLDDDPHFWLDPIRLGQAARIVAQELAALSPDRGWADRADGYRSELETLDEEIRSTLAVIPAGRRKLVTNHDTLEYFARRYDFQVVGTVIPGGSTLARPSSGELAHLVEVIRAEEVPAVFVDTTSPADLAETVAAELGAQVEVYTLHSEALGKPGSAATTYVGLMRQNAQTIARALG